MKEVFFITPETVRNHGYTHKNVLPDTIKTTIKRVQAGMLRKVMGKSSYDDLVTAVINSLPPTSPVVPLTDYQKELIDDYIQPYLVACVDYRIIYPLTLRHRSKGVGKGQDEGHIPADLTELIKLKDQMKQDVDTYAEMLVDFLKKETCDTPAKKVTLTTAIRFR